MSSEPASDRTGFRYWAFLSYSHRDKKWGDWLHKALETYHVPSRLIGRVFEPSGADPSQVLNEIREKLRRAPTDADWTTWGRWFLADRSTRTISPFSRITIPEYIENRIKEGTSGSLDEAERLAPGHTEILKRIAQARAELEAKNPTMTRSPTDQ